MNRENERLRGILDQINDKYHSLKMHIISLSQNQHNPISEAKAGNHKVCKNSIYILELN